MNNKILKRLLPIAILLLGVLATIILIYARPDVKKQPVEVIPPLVRVLDVVKTEHRMVVTSQGTVTPKTESTLIAQVAGQIIKTSRSFAPGGFFNKGDVLVHIDPRDYELAVTRARAQVALAELRLAREQEEAEIARDEWQRIGKGEPTPLVLRMPQIKEAQAALDAARSTLQKAEIDLERTQIRAPYRGRIRIKNADVGQFVGPGTPLAVMYAIEYAEVRLPIPDAELAFLDFPVDFRDARHSGKGPEVEISAEFAGTRHAWAGYIDRLEGEIDARSRMVHVVARIDDPYGKNSGNPIPLAIGLFVDARITGKVYQDIVALPREALRNENQVLVVDDENRLYFRNVSVLRKDKDTIYIQHGLENGERVCLSPLEVVVEGMKVRTSSESNDNVGGQSAGNGAKQ